MALLLVDKGAFPQRYGIKTTQYQYTERGQKRTLHYVYAETDASITPFTSYKPTVNMAQVCRAGDPTLFPMYTSGGIYPVEWQETTAVRTFNSGTAYEFDLTVITSCRAICNGTDIGGWSWGANSAITTHIQAGLLDYHLATGRGTSISILDADGKPTSQCYIQGERNTGSSGLHGFFARAMFQEVYDTPTSHHTEYVGDEQVELTNYGLSGNPVVAAETIVVAPYTCDVTLSYI